ncbi:MAG: hypothetical protein AB1696_13255 [Planctomycetota bacterium]
MRRRICCVWLCITFALITPYDAQAQSKKKAKEPELAISKRGNLIFEDDFSEKELKWRLLQETCSWKITKGKLVSTDAWANIARDIPSTSGLILQFTVDSSDSVTEVHLLNGTKPSQRLYLSVYPKSCLKVTRLDESRNKEHLLVTPLVSKADASYTVLFESIEGKVCLSAFGKSVVHDTGVKDLIYSLIQLNFRKDKGSFIAIDDVKVWEALPKDAPGVKEEKTAEAKDEKPSADAPKPDEAKSADAEKPKDERPPVQPANALGKDADGKPIV